MTSVQTVPNSSHGKTLDNSTVDACTIPLTKGYVALVSPVDYARVAAHKWHALLVGGLVYAQRTGPRPGRETILPHRFILDTPKGERLDHENRDGLDCQRPNLRPATQSQNMCNRRLAPGKHGFIGVVSRHPGRYYGKVVLNGVQHHTPMFSSPHLAAAARDFLALELHGEFAVLNFPIFSKR